MTYLPTVSGWPTLANLANQLDPDGTLAPVGELLNETNEILDDMPFYEANQTSSHVHTIDATLPSGTWRRLNYGIVPTKGTTAQVTEGIGMLEDRSEVDVVLARMSRDVAAFRLQEDRRTIEGLNQELADVLFYADTTVDPEKYMGLAPRYENLGVPTGKPTANYLGMNHVLDAGGSTTSVQSSIWLVGWGESTVFGLYPKGSPAGLERMDLGEIDCRDATGGVFRGYATHYRIQHGLGVKDWRYIVRIANIETSAAIDENAINVLVDQCIDATNAIPNLGACRPVFYMNRAVRSRFQKAAFRKSNMALSLDDVYGVKGQLNISGIPLKQSDAILLTETVLT